MAIIAGIVIVVVVILGIIVLSFPYFEGRDDAQWPYNSYSNGYSGLMASAYDTGYNSIGAAKERKKRNLEANKKRLEARGE